MKILKIYGIAFAILFLLCTFVFIPPFFLPGPDIDIPVYSKTTAREIARNLEEKGIIHFSLPFRVLAKLTHADRRLKAGLYRLNPRMSLWGVLTTLSQGRSELLTLKVPEGYTTEQIAQELEKLKVIQVPDFLKAGQDKRLLKSLGINGPSAEGFLFPQTYRVPLSADGGALVELLARQFFDSVGGGFRGPLRPKGIDALPGRYFGFYRGEGSPKSRGKAHHRGNPFQPPSPKNKAGSECHIELRSGQQTRVADQ